MYEATLRGQKFKYEPIQNIGLYIEAALGRLFNGCLLKVAYSLLLIDHRKVDINIR